MHPPHTINALAPALNVQPKHCLLHIRNLAEEFGTHIEDPFFMESVKICRLKYFGWDVLHKESSAPFLLTIQMLKSVFVAIFQWKMSTE